MRLFVGLIVASFIALPAAFACFGGIYGLKSQGYAGLKNEVTLSGSSYDVDGKTTSFDATNYPVNKPITEENIIYRDPAAGINVQIVYIKTAPGGRISSTYYKILSKSDPAHPRIVQVSTNVTESGVVTRGLSIAPAPAADVPSPSQIAGCGGVRNVMGDSGGGSPGGARAGGISN